HLLPSCSSLLLLQDHPPPPAPHSSPTRRSSDLHFAFACSCPTSLDRAREGMATATRSRASFGSAPQRRRVSENCAPETAASPSRSEEHTSELQSRRDLVCRLLLEKKKNGNRVWG